jgi:hypothetical protein
MNENMKLKILNAYAGKGGNRELWGDEHQITAVELNPKIAAILFCKRLNLAAVTVSPIAICFPYNLSTHSINFSPSSLLVSNAIPIISLATIVLATPSFHA